MRKSHPLRQRAGRETDRPLLRPKQLLLMTIRILAGTTISHTSFRKLQILKITEALGVSDELCPGRGYFCKYMLDWGVENKQIWPRNRYKALQAGVFIILIRKTLMI